MKKKYIQLIVIAVVLLGGIAALLFLRQQPPATDAASSAAEKTYVYGNAESPTPAEVQIAGEAGSYTVVSQDADSAAATGVIKGYESLPLDNNGLGAALKNAKAMEYKSVITEQATDGDLDTYGLKSPRATVTATASDGGKTTFYLGIDAPGSEGVYMANSDKTKIYLITTTIAAPFLKTDLAYINTTITAADTENTGFDKLVLSGARYPEQIVIERTPEDATEAGGVKLNTHKIVSPIQTGVDATKGMEPLAAVYGITADEAVAIGDDAEALKKFGLDKPAVSLDITGPAEKPELTFSLRISEADAEGNVFLHKQGTAVIYKISSSALPWLNLTLFDIREKMVTLPYIDSVSAIKLVLPDKSYVFALTGEGDELKVTLDGKELPEVTKADGKTASGSDNFRQFYQTLISAKYDEEAEEQPAADAASIMQIEYSFRDGKETDIVTFYQGPARKVYISHNGEEAFLSQSIYYDRVLEDIVKIANGEAVKSYI